MFGDLVVRPTPFAQDVRSEARLPMASLWVKPAALAVRFAVIYTSPEKKRLARDRDLPHSSE